MIHVFIVGCKGIPAKYGGFETFVENLTAKKQSKDIKYHVSCMNNNEKHFEYNDSDCFNIKVPLPGAPGRIFHVGLVLRNIEKWIKNHPNEKTIIYILGCRIGPLLIPHSKRLHKLGATIYCNPDGLEWRRDKWNKLAKVFLKYCESCLVCYSDLTVCDSKTIKQYIQDTYGSKVKETTYISYGAELEKSMCSEEKLYEWYGKFSIKANDYFLIVGRFVPENNFETIITEFMKSNTKKDLVIITNVEKNGFYNNLLEKTHFDKDKRIKFVGTVYDRELLKKIREEAFAYIHGHSVGGTNPSLLEALGSTDINLLYDVGYNREVAEDSAIYWNKTDKKLRFSIEYIDQMDSQERSRMHNNACRRISKYYSWPLIIDMYEKRFLYEK